MDDKKSEITIKIRRGAKGGYCIDLDNNFDVALSSAGEALQWFSSTLGDQFGEAPKPSDKETAKHELLEEMVEHMRRRVPAVVTPGIQYPAHRGRPPELPDQHAIDSGYEHAPEHDQDMPSVVRQQQPADALEELTVKLRNQMPGANGRHSIVALAAFSGALMLWRFAQASGIA